MQGIARRVVFRQRGQSLVEFLVAGLVIIPLFLLIPLIGKYLDIKQSSIQAARKLAFECTVRYQDCDDLNAHPGFADEIRMRVFAGNRMEVLSNDRPDENAIEDSEFGNRLWVDNQGRPLLENFDDVGVRTDQANLDFGVTRAALDNPVSGPRVFGLDLERGVFNARVQVALSRALGGENFEEQLNSLRLDMQQNAAILTDAWSASGPGDAGDRCRGNATVVSRITNATFCPAPFQASYAAYQPALLLRAPLAVFESNNGSFDFHRFVDRQFVERVPTADPVGYPRLQ